MVMAYETIKSENYIFMQQDVFCHFGCTKVERLLESRSSLFNCEHIDEGFELKRARLFAPKQKDYAVF